MALLVYVRGFLEYARLAHSSVVMTSDFDFEDGGSILPGPTLVPQMDVVTFFGQAAWLAVAFFALLPLFSGGAARPYGLSSALRRRRKPAASLSKGFPVPLILKAPKGSGISRPLARLLGPSRSSVISGL